MRAAVTTEFPCEVGDRVEASSPDEAVEAVASFRNLRIRSQQDPLAALPDCANAAYAHEEFDTVRTLGGGSSFFLLRRGKSDGSIHVLDEPKSEIGVVVTIDDETLDAPAARELEGEAIGYLNMLRGVRVETAQPLTLALTGDAHPAEQLAEVVRRGLRLEYPRLGPIDVTITGNQREIARLAKEAGAEWQAREDALRAYADANVVYSCEACAPFSREHVCFAHPLRNPMCGRRWAEMLVGARYMGLSSGRPWRRRGRPENCCAVVDLGRAIDPLKGEYEALNAFVRQATNDRMQRVFLHSVREFPHSSCGCFAALAWWSDGLGGIAIMHRGFDGVAPDGSTWNLLANRAGGKQQPGITGVGLEYMRSPLFLQGDGGWKNVKWMTRKLQEELEGSIPAVTQIPTEAE
jgi:acetyl-CoA decarbonylase/synthase complex subunit beta